MSRKRWLALISVVMLLVISGVLSQKTSDLFGGTSSLLNSDNDWSETIVENGKDLGGSIAVLELNGVIQNTGGGFFDTGEYNHEQFLAQLDHAAVDPSVEGIILQVNTPGGGVIESAEIHERIINAQEEYGKPVFVSMGNMAASGGYYIAAPADKIVARAQTITGSIGVIMESVNFAELAEKYGVKINTIKSGPYKDIMSPTREMTDEERAILQSLIDESYDEFVNIIADGRGMSLETVRKIGDGRIYSGKQALELNLIDELGGLKDTIAYMKEYVGADYPVMKYESNGGFGQFFSMSAERLLSRDHELVGIERLLSYDRSPMLKYLYTE